MPNIKVKVLLGPVQGVKIYQDGEIFEGDEGAIAPLLKLGVVEFVEEVKPDKKIKAEVSA